MPAEYPGLYWDEARNRYFPISSRPKSFTPSTAASNHTVDANGKLEVQARTRRPRLDLDRRHHAHVPWHTNLNRISRSCYTQTLRNSHDILCFHYSNTSSCNTERLPTLGPIQAFCSARMDGKTCQFAGDDQGWLYTRTALASENINNHRWSADPILRSSDPISSISTSDSHCVVTCLGPGKVSVQNMLDPDVAKAIESTRCRSLFMLNFTSIHDIWTSSLRGSTLVLGASKKASYLPDVDRTRTPEHLNTNSDVFSIAQQNTLVYLGTRSGSVHRFDMRMPKNRNQKLFDNRFGKSPRSSVLHLDIIREYEFLMSHLNGELVMHDLRFAPETSKAPPVRVFEGHVNTYTRNLGITIDHERDLLFAAGQDCRIRAWSLRTGTTLTPSSFPSQLEIRRVKQTNPLLDTFSDPIHALQVADEIGAGVTLWAASGRQVYQYRLGQRWAN